VAGHRRLVATHQLAGGCLCHLGGIFLATVAWQRLGRFNAGLQRRAPWLLASGVVPDPVGSRDREARRGCRCRSSRRRSPIIEVYTDDLPKLLDSIFASVKLQLGADTSSAPPSAS
jgi:NitT/TauT family transport system permease protein